MSRKEEQRPTVVSPVAVPGVSSQPVGGPVLLPPAKDLNSVTSKDLPCHMLVDPCSDTVLCLNSKREAYSIGNPYFKDPIMGILKE